MNDWTSKGYYSGSFIADQQAQTRLYRQYWDENWDQGYVDTGYNMNGYVIKDYQKPTEVPSNFTSENLGIPSTYSFKKKKNGSDPRFRRVISTDFRNDQDMEAEKLESHQKDTQTLYDPISDDRTLDKVMSYFKNPNAASFLTPQTTTKSKKENENSKKDLSNQVTKDTGLNPVTGALMYPSCDDRIQAFDKFKIQKESEKIKKNSSMKLKRSVSDCTLNKKKHFGEEKGDEHSEKLRAYPSATRLSVVHNWMKNYKFPEKRRSVITVIGQTQTKPFSKILSEITQRRKLAKELDKHALCEAILGPSESQPKDVKNIVAKVDLVLPDGKLICSTEKVYLGRDSKMVDSSMYPNRSIEVLEAGDQKKNRCDMIPEKDSSISQICKKNRTKRSNRKMASVSKGSRKVKDTIKLFWGNPHALMIWSVLGVFCVSLLLVFYCLSYKESESYFPFDYFKPKTTTWYEKLLFS